jgi:crotonobetainyl-CoA:carnitine CoA-transferase CaiB-like acyl-CoA transferase
MADIFADPHYAARGSIAHVAGGELDSVAMPAPVPRLSATPGVIRHAGGVVGCDTAEVLREMAGVTPEQMERLHADGVVFDAALSAAAENSARARHAAETL